MKSRVDTIATLTTPQGFLAAGISCGIKSSGKLDLALLFCPTGARAAAVFTTNAIQSAAVLVCKEHIQSPTIYGVVINSGNANTCTGKAGLNDARLMCKQFSRCLHVPESSVLIASTGIIGNRLPIKKIIQGIQHGAAQLSSGPQAGADFAHAIMTTDKQPKQAATQIRLAGKPVWIAGTVKGAGMIGPNMATTICVLTTDAAISHRLLKKALSAAIDQTLNRLTVDGLQSTNDTAMILASGLAANPPITKQNDEYEVFADALYTVCMNLARQMALDAEGASRMFTVRVKGAASAADAYRAARAVANYDLVKCAVHGADPNWGRIICAVGSSGAKVDPEKLCCKIGSIYVFRNGQPTRFDPKKVSRIIAQKEHTITVELNIGKYEDFCIGCDLSAEYVSINADYHT